MEFIYGPMHVLKEKIAKDFQGEKTTYKKT